MSFHSINFEYIWTKDYIRYTFKANLPTFWYVWDRIYCSFSELCKTFHNRTCGEWRRLYIKTFSFEWMCQFRCVHLGYWINLVSKHKTLAKTNKFYNKINKVGLWRYRDWLTWASLQFEVFSIRSQLFSLYVIHRMQIIQNHSDQTEWKVKRTKK